MRSVLEWKRLFQYMTQKLEFASLVILQYHAGQIGSKDIWTSAVKTLLTRRMTDMVSINSLEMKPIVFPQDTLVISGLPYLNSRLKRPLQEINVGDVVVLKDPLNSNKFIVRKLAAVEGYEMASTVEDDEPFVLEEGQAWVLSANSSLTPKESKDSRTYGPVSMSNIIGRVIYRFRSLEDEGFIMNNKDSLKFDMLILHVELDIEEIQRFTDEQNKKNKSS